MKITHIFAQNFCKLYGVNTLDADFSMKTVLSGQNEVGKSTVKRIILDVLNCHDENDREITGIRPHDENGVEIDDVDITRAVGMVPTDVDMTGNSEYQALKATIEEKEKALADENDTSELIRKLKNERNELLRQVSSVDTKIELGVANNKRIDDSIADLEDKRTNLNQEIADWERKLDLLKEFTRKKNELLQADVNKYLDFATAKLFRPLLNGDTEECCDFVYNGEAYARNLNHGARMLTEVDICRAFQKVANVNFPIIIDDTESVDDWRIPQIDNQLILLKHTQDKELVIEAV